MKVKDLIEVLKKANPEHEVLLPPNTRPILSVVESDDYKRVLLREFADDGILRQLYSEGPPRCSVCGTTGGHHARCARNPDNKRCEHHYLPSGIYAQGVKCQFCGDEQGTSW